MTKSTKIEIQVLESQIAEQKVKLAELVKQLKLEDNINNSITLADNGKLAIILHECH